jgi:hypothetical protein
MLAVSEKKQKIEANTDMQTSWKLQRKIFISVSSL